MWRRPVSVAWAPPTGMQYRFGGTIGSWNSGTYVCPGLIGTSTPLHGWRRHCAALQADLGDATGGIDTCLKIANHAGYLEKTESYVDWNYLFIEAILARLQPTTGIGTDVFLTRDFSRSP